MVVINAFGNLQESSFITKLLVYCSTLNVIKEGAKGEENFLQTTSFKEKVMEEGMLYIIAPPGQCDIDGGWKTQFLEVCITKRMEGGKCMSIGAL